MSDNNCKKEYTDNLISEYVISEWERKLLQEVPKCKEYLPLVTYDMVQCGYPLPDHGEMTPRYFGDIAEDGSMGLPKGMWCKVEDVQKLINCLMY